MPDSDKTFWETVQKEPSNKLHRRDGDRFCSLFLSIFSGEGHLAVFKFFDAAVGNGHPVGVAGKIFEDLLWALEADLCLFGAGFWLKDRPRTAVRTPAGRLWVWVVLARACAAGRRLPRF